MRVSIHQPNFMPWMPFFEKIRSVDRFIIMKHCQFEKNKYQNRFNYHDRWHTMSVNKGLEPIVNKRYVSVDQDWCKIKASLAEFRSVLESFDSFITPDLSQTNIGIIHRIVELLGISTELVEDYPTELLGTARLVDLCVRNGADTYLSGVSGSKYLDMTLFDRAGIKVEFQEIGDRSSIIEVLNVQTK